VKPGGFVALVAVASRWWLLTPGLLPALLALVEPTQRGHPRVLIAEVRRRQ
jgi:hypothetical protein